MVRALETSAALGLTLLESDDLMIWCFWHQPRRAYSSTFVMSLFFWNFCMCNVYCSFYVLFHFCILSTSLVLAMLTYVSHANKAEIVSVRERERERESAQMTTSTVAFPGVSRLTKRVRILWFPFVIKGSRSANCSHGH